MKICPLNIILIFNFSVFSVLFVAECVCVLSNVIRIQRPRPEHNERSTLKAKRFAESVHICINILRAFYFRQLTHFAVNDVSVGRWRSRCGNKHSTPSVHSIQFGIQSIHFARPRVTAAIKMDLEMFSRNATHETTKWH